MSVARVAATESVPGAVATGKKEVRVLITRDAKMPPEPGSILGLARSTLGQEPINGLRHPPEGNTSGWYIWCGDSFSEEEDFFEPLHVEHIDDYLPMIKKYLDLPPGWRFQIDTEGYEDVWFDASLVEVE